MKIGKSLIILLLVLLISVPLIAAELAVKWDYSTAEQKNIDGFRIYNNDNIVILDHIAPEKRSAKLQKPSTSTGFYCVAYKSGEESKPSKIAIYNPPVFSPIGPTKFILTLEPIK